MKPSLLITGVLLALSLFMIACGSGAAQTVTPWPTEKPAPTARAGSPVAPVAAAPASTFRLTILHNNDGESQLINLGTGLEDFGGAAQFAAVVQREKRVAVSGETSFGASHGKSGVIMVSAGDNFLAGPEFTVGLRAGTFYDALAMDLIGYDAIALGNHDFDFGPEVLAKFIKQMSASQAPFLSSNLDFSGEPVLRDLFNQGRIAGSVVVVKNGERIGIIGATTPLLGSISSPRRVRIIADVAGEVQAEVDRLEASGVNKIVLLSHLQDIDADIVLVGQIHGVDVVVAGGGDELLANECDVLIPGYDALFGPYPIMATAQDGIRVPVVTTAGQYSYLGKLNQSQSGIYMDGGINTGLSGSEELLCPSLQDSPAPLLDLFPPRGQLGEEVTQFFLHRGSGAQAQVRGGLFPCPVPDRLGSIEIRTVSRQAHQSQAQAGGSQVGTHGVTMMGWSVVPDDVQWSGVLIPQLLQESGRGFGVAVPLQFHNLHLASLQAHRRIIAGLFAPPGAARIYQRRLSLEYPFPPQVRIRPEMGLISEEGFRPQLSRFDQECGIRRHEGFPLGFVGLKEMLLWPLQDKTQAVGVVQATAAGQRVPEAFLDKSPHHFPVPIRQVDACLFGQRLDRSLQLGLLVSVEGGGEPPDCSKARAVGPPVPKAVTHMPMLWESRSSASATADAVQPKAKSQSACHRSRSRGVDARYMRLRTSPTSSCHRSRSCTMSLIPNTTATLLPLQTNAAPFQV